MVGALYWCSDVYILQEFASISLPNRHTHEFQERHLLSDPYCSCGT